jgi:hypothetical protein
MTAVWTDSFHAGPSLKAGQVRGHSTADIRLSSQARTFQSLTSLAEAHNVPLNKASSIKNETRNIATDSPVRRWYAIMHNGKIALQLKMMKTVVFVTREASILKIDAAAIPIQMKKITKAVATPMSLT